MQAKGKVWFATSFHLDFLYLIASVYFLSTKREMRLLAVLLLFLLLFLLCVVVEVYSQRQTYPYVSFMAMQLPNHSYVDFNLVGENDNDGLQCHTNIDGCCFVFQDGNWSFPNGDTVKSTIFFNGYYMRSERKHIDLHYKGDRREHTSGLYQCKIEVNGNVSTFQGIIYIGLYSSNGGEEN